MIKTTIETRNGRLRNLDLGIPFLESLYTISIEVVAKTCSSDYIFFLTFFDRLTRRLKASSRNPSVQTRSAVT